MKKAFFFLGLFFIAVAENGMAFAVHKALMKIGRKVRSIVVQHKIREKSADPLLVGGRIGEELEVVLGKFTSTTSDAMYRHDTLVDILIPVYNGYDLLVKMMGGLLRNTEARHNIIICNDSSTDERVDQFLQEMLLENKGRNIRVLKNQRNLGFIKTINLLAEEAENHFVILNTDTEVPRDWLNRLIWPILQNPEKIASTTPYTNSGTICSFPRYMEDNELMQGCDVQCVDEVFKHVNSSSYIEIPTGVGFCMAFNSQVVKRIGMFDELYGRGYGEENDWCMRAFNEGFVNIHVPNLFVYHKHGGSFSSKEKDDLINKNTKLLLSRYPEYLLKVQKAVEEDQLKDVRKFLTVMVRSSAENVYLIFNHNFGGGAAEFAKNLMGNAGVWGEVKYLKDTGVFSLIFLAGDEQLSPVYTFSDIKCLSKLFELINFDRVYINSLVGYPRVMEVAQDIKNICSRYNLRLQYFLHDYYFICPSYHLINDKNEYYGIPDENVCASCIKGNKYARVISSDVFDDYDQFDIKSWRSVFGDLIHACDEIDAYSISSKSLLLRCYPEIVDENITVTYHKVDWVEPVALPKLGAVLNIGVIGTMAYHKGSEIIYEFAKSAELLGAKIRFHIFGNIHEAGQRFDYVPNIVLHGKYQKTELSSLMKYNSIDCIFIPSIWPETFSYTAEEAMAMNMPLVAFDLGAPAERVINYSKGIVLKSYEPSMCLNQINEQLRQLHNDSNNVSKPRVEIYQIYYDPCQRDQLSKFVIPYFNPVSTKSKVWHEVEVFVREYQLMPPVSNDHYVGYLSWKFENKTGLHISDFNDFIQENLGYDVYFINPFFELADMYSNVWDQGEFYHPGIKDLAKKLFNIAGLNVCIDDLVNDSSTLLYCNYFVGNKRFWDSYMKLVVKIYQFIESGDEAVNLYLDDSGYHTGAGFVPFIIERLFSTWIKTSGVRYLSYNYSNIEKSSNISKLRVVAGG